MCCARASSARLPRWSTGGLELLLRWFACAAAASAVGGAALVAMRPALKTGQLKLGAGAARGSPLLSLARMRAAVARVPGLRRKRSGVLVPCSRRPRPPRPQTHRASAFPATFLFPRLSHGGFHTPGVPRSVRGVNLTCRISSFCLGLLLFWRCSLCAPRTRFVLQIQTRTLASV